MRTAEARGRRSRVSALSRRARAAHLRERLQGSVGAMGQAPDHAHERESPDPDRAQGTQVPGRDGEVLLRRRFGETEGIRAEIARARRLVSS